MQIGIRALGRPQVPPGGYPLDRQRRLLPKQVPQGQLAGSLFRRFARSRSGQPSRFNSLRTPLMVDTNNSVYSSMDGVLCNKKQTMLIQFPGGKAGK